MKHDIFRKRLEEYYEKRECFIQCIKKNLENHSFHSNGVKFEVLSIRPRDLYECYAICFKGSVNDFNFTLSNILSEVLIALSRVARDLNKKYIVVKYTGQGYGAKAVMKIFIVDEHEKEIILKVLHESKIKIFEVI